MKQVKFFNCNDSSILEKEINCWLQESKVCEKVIKVLYSATYARNITMHSAMILYETIQK